MFVITQPLLTFGKSAMLMNSFRWAVVQILQSYWCVFLVEPLTGCFPLHLLCPQMPQITSLLALFYLPFISQDKKTANGSYLENLPIPQFYGFLITWIVILLETQPPYPDGRARWLPVSGSFSPLSRITLFYIYTPI